jgi:hypothetical protein
MTRPSNPRQRSVSPTSAPGTGPEPRSGKAEERRGTAEVSREGAEATRDQAEQARALAEEGRDLAEEVRRGAELLRVRQAGTEDQAEYGRHTLETALRAEAWLGERFDTLLEGIQEMRSELQRLRAEAAELRRTLADMQQAASEERIIAAERQATEQLMDRERRTESG